MQFIVELFHINVIQVHYKMVNVIIILVLLEEILLILVHQVILKVVILVIKLQEAGEDQEEDGLESPMPYSRYRERPVKETNH